MKPDQPALPEERETLHDVQVSKFAAASLEQALSLLALSESRIDSLGLVVAGIAHDINNLLTVMSGFGAILQKQVAGDKQATIAVNGLLEASSQLGSLTRMLSCLASKRSISAESIDVGGVLTGMEPTVAHLLGDDITVEILPHPMTGCIHAVRGQLERVLLNLVLNAREAMGAKGILRIDSRPVRISDQEAAQKRIAAGDWLSLTVADSGCGMTAETLVHVFEPSFSTKGREGGGRGLATVRRIVRECGGEVFVDSQIGRGATFELLFPLIESGSTARPNLIHQLLVKQTDQKVDSIQTA